MSDCQYRMASHHAWSGISHDRTGLFPHGGGVAVDATMGAGGLGAFEGALIQPRVDVREQLTAFRAKIIPASVFSAAVKTDHGADSPALSRHSSVLAGSRSHARTLILRPYSLSSFLLSRLALSSGGLDAGTSDPGRLRHPTWQLRLSGNQSLEGKGHQRFLDLFTGES